MKDKDIERLRKRLRALYWLQDVYVPHGWNKAIQLHYENLESSFGHLLLKPISSMTNEDIIRIQFREFKDGFSVSKMEHDEKDSYFVLTLAHIIDRDGLIDKYHEKISFHYRNPLFKEYQYLIQNSFAMPYYDHLTGTIISVEQQVKFGLIKLIKPTQ